MAMQITRDRKGNHKTYTKVLNSDFRFPPDFSIFSRTRGGVGVWVWGWLGVGMCVGGSIMPPPKRLYRKPYF